MTRQLTLGLLIFCCLFSASAQEVIVNELYNSSGNDEWVELLVVTDSTDLRGWSLRDFTSAGNPQNPLTFSGNALWSALAKGTVIVIGRPETAFAEDVDPSDHLLVLLSSNAAYFSGTVFSFAGASDAIQIRKPTGAHVFGVSWGSANLSSIPDPKIFFAGSLPSGTAVSFTGSSTAELTTASAWSFGNVAPTRGTGNSPANASWIAGLRANPDGSGTASVTPDTAWAGQKVPLTVRYRRDTPFVITDMRIILPPGFLWSGSPADVLLEQMSATTSIAGDTVNFAGLSFSTDSALITILGVTVPDSTSRYPVDVQTRGATQFKSVGPVPVMVVFGLPAPIGDVKQNDALGVPLRLNSLVTVRGIVTVANEFGGPSYIQDPTGGLGIFGSTFSSAVSIGDEVVVSGTVQPFSGLTELVNPVLHAVLSRGNHTEPMPVTTRDIRDDGAGGVEHYEGRLVRLAGVIAVGSGSWQPNTNYPLVSGGDTTELRIDNSTSIVGTPIPGSAFDLVGVVGQYVTVSPFIGGYQVMPRSPGDIFSSGPVFTTFPVETSIEPTAVTLTWRTLAPGSSKVRYGRTPLLEIGVSGTDSAAVSHSVRVGGLEAATFYHLQAFSAAGAESSVASVVLVSTASPPQTTGVIHVYFNKSVNTGVAWDEQAAGGQDLAVRLITRIDGARRSIDAALYNLSGTPGAGTMVATALVNARNRGVSIRVICEAANRNTSPFATLAANGIPLVTDAADPVLKGAGLMHNKFLVIDGRGGAPDSVWVWTGSWNPTQSGTYEDDQNALEIQDMALAGAYTAEFDEMWGSTTETPNTAACRFGARKTDNTPHRFAIGGRPVECYFSPSDNTTARIVAAIDSARHSIGFALLTMTRTDLRNALVGRKADGLSVRGVIDNSTDAGSQYSSLLAAGVDVHLKPTSSTYLLHHKYAVLDAEDPAWDPVTITGSHNWTNSAENSNDENTVIIKDGRVANLYLQEFSARYYQYGGTDSIQVGVKGGEEEMHRSFVLLQNYPNPFNPKTVISFDVPSLNGVEGPVASVVRLVVYDLLGREVATLMNERKSPGRYSVVFDASRLTSGVYFYRLDSGGSTATKKMMVVR